MAFFPFRDGHLQNDFLNTGRAGGGFAVFTTSPAEMTAGPASAWIKQPGDNSRLRGDQSTRKVSIMNNPLLSRYLTNEAVFKTRPCLHTFVSIRANSTAPQYVAVRHDESTTEWSGHQQIALIIFVDVYAGSSPISVSASSSSIFLA